MTTLARDLLAAIDPVVTFADAFGEAPHEWQVGYLREHRPVALLKGRQVGASTAAATLAIHAARYWPDSNSVIVSPTLPQSREVAMRARIGLRNLGERLVQDSASVLRLANGSRILSLPGTARSVRGWTARLLIIDEAAFVLPETFTAAQPIIATGGRIVIQSTPAGESGDFHAIVTGDDPAWARYTVPSTSVSTITPEWLEGQRRTMAPDAFAQEFECVFGKAGATLFTPERIASLILTPEAA